MKTRFKSILPAVVFIMSFFIAVNAGTTDDLLEKRPVYIREITSINDTRVLSIMDSLIVGGDTLVSYKRRCYDLVIDYDKDNTLTVFASLEYENDRPMTISEGGLDIYGFYRIRENIMIISYREGKRLSFPRRAKGVKFIIDPCKMMNDGAMEWEYKADDTDIRLIDFIRFW